MWCQDYTRSRELGVLADERLAILRAEAEAEDAAGAQPTPRPLHQSSNALPVHHSRQRNTPSTRQSQQQTTRSTAQSHRSARSANFRASRSDVQGTNLHTSTTIASLIPNTRSTGDSYERRVTTPNVQPQASPAVLALIDDPHAVSNPEADPLIPTPEASDFRYQEWSPERILLAEQAYRQALARPALAEVGCVGALAQLHTDIQRWQHKWFRNRLLSLTDKEDIKALRALGGIHPLPCISDLGSKILGHLACHVMQATVWRYGIPSPLLEENMWHTRFAEDHIVNFLYSPENGLSAPALAQSDIMGFVYQNTKGMQWHLLGKNARALPFQDQRKDLMVDHSLQSLFLRPRINPEAHSSLSRVVRVTCQRINANYISKEDGQNEIISVTIFNGDEQETVSLPKYATWIDPRIESELKSKTFSYEHFAVFLLTTVDGGMVVYDVTGRDCGRATFFESHPEWEDSYPEELKDFIHYHPLERPVLILEPSELLLSKRTWDDWVSQNHGLLRHPHDTAVILDEKDVKDVAVVRNAIEAGYNQFLSRMKAESKIKDLLKELDRKKKEVEELQKELGR
jgi:hypothetical protein